MPRATRMGGRDTSFAAALAQARAWLDTVDGVRGVAAGVHDGRECVTVYIADATVAKRLPERVGTYAVVTAVTGPIRTSERRH